MFEFEFFEIIGGAEAPLTPPPSIFVRFRYGFSLFAVVKCNLLFTHDLCTCTGGSLCSVVENGAQNVL